jgi:hypothetical protein
MAFTDRIYRALAMGMAVPGVAMVASVYELYTVALLALLIGTPAAYLINAH